MTKPSVILLGPQRRRPNVGEVVSSLGLEGPFALITAGWQEREAETDELCEAIGGTAVNLEIYRRLEQVLEGDHKFASAYRKRQRLLRELQELYRQRLADAMRSTRRLMAQNGDGELLEVERESALEVVRQLDRHHLARVADIHRRYDRASSLLAKQRAEVAQRIHDAEAVLIAGGHVAVLLNRLLAFDLARELHHKRVIAWSAGAMAVSERIVLFHDSPPQGAGNAELLDRGMGLCRGLLPLPDGSRRLSLSDRARVSVMARRFHDLRAAVLDAGARLDYLPPHWRSSGVRTLQPSGEVTAW